MSYTPRHPGLGVSFWDQQLSKRALIYGNVRSASDQQNVMLPELNWIAINASHIPLAKASHMTKLGTNGPRKWIPPDPKPLGKEHGYTILLREDAEREP